MPDKISCKYRVPVKWDKRFLALAEHIAGWSKDPSTKTGAVITNGRRVVSVGFNGFPPGVMDDHYRYANRELKYKMIVHCERNAIIFARQPLDGCTLYTWPFQSCAACAAMVIAAGIKRCVAPPCGVEKWDRWGDEFHTAKVMFDEANVTLDILGDKYVSG